MSNGHIEANYKKWVNLSKIITSNKEHIDLLHDLIIRLNHIPDDKATDNYIFMSLRNLFIDRVKKSNKIEVVDISENYELSYEETDENILQIDKIKQDKLDSIAIVVSNLNHFEKKLYQLHFVFGISQRKIAKEIDVSHITINSRINKIKEKINIFYES